MVKYAGQQLMKEEIRVVIHNEKIVMLVNGKLTADFPPEAARALALALNHQAGMIENEKRNIENPLDQALLMRVGAPIGLTSNAKLLEESYKEAQWNRDLRRNVKSAENIQSKEKFGLPIIKGGAICQS